EHLSHSCLFFGSRHLASSAAAQARFGASQEALLFGNRAVGSSSAANVTVTNCGNAPWTFTDVSVDPATGAGWNVFSGCTTGLTLVPGAACSVSVTFAPRGTGEASAGLCVRSAAAE